MKVRKAKKSENSKRRAKEAARQDAHTETIRQRFLSAEQLEGTKTELDIERGHLVQRLRLNLEEQNI